MSNRRLQGIGMWGPAAVGLFLLAGCASDQQTTLVEDSPRMTITLYEGTGENPEIFEPIPGGEYTIKIIPPEPGVEHKIVAIRPDPDTDFKMNLINPYAGSAEELARMLPQLPMQPCPEQPENTPENERESP